MNAPINCSEKVEVDCNREPLCNFITGGEISAMRNNINTLGSENSPITFEDITGRGDSYLNDYPYNQGQPSGVCKSNPDSLEFTLVAMQIQQALNNQQRDNQLTRRFNSLDTRVNTIDTSLSSRFDNLVGAIWVPAVPADGVGGAYAPGYYEYPVDTGVCPNGISPVPCSSGPSESQCCRISTIRELSNNVINIRDRLTDVQIQQGDLTGLLVDLNSDGVCIDDDGVICDADTAAPTTPQLTDFFTIRKNIEINEVYVPMTREQFESGDVCLLNPGAIELCEASPLEATCTGMVIEEGGGETDCATFTADEENCGSVEGCILNIACNAQESCRWDETREICLPSSSNNDCISNLTQGECNAPCSYTPFSNVDETWNDAPLSQQNNIPCNAPVGSEAECIYIPGDRTLYEQDAALMSQFSDFQGDMSESIGALQGAVSAGDAGDPSSQPGWRYCNNQQLGNQISDDGPLGMYSCPGWIVDDARAAGHAIYLRPGAEPLQCVSDCSYCRQSAIDDYALYTNPGDPVVMGNAEGPTGVTCVPP
jgi:hypothetical protein